MGMFTTILGPFGKSCQIKTGWDNCDTYKITDKIPWKPKPHRPGEHIDGVHLGYGECNNDTIVVIKDCTVAAILPRWWDKNLDVQIAMLKLDYGLRPPARSLWSEEAWAEKEALLKEIKEEQEKWDREHAHLTPEEKMAAITGEYLKRKMSEQSLAKQILPPAPKEEASKMKEEAPPPPTMPYSGIEGCVPELGATVRECLDCGCLTPGGPTRCKRCAKEAQVEGEDSKTPEEKAKEVDKTPITCALCGARKSNKETWITVSMSDPRTPNEAPTVLRVCRRCQRELSGAGSETKNAGSKPQINCAWCDAEFAGMSPYEVAKHLSLHHTQGLSKETAELLNKEADKMAAEEEIKQQSKMLQEKLDEPGAKEKISRACHEYIMDQYRKRTFLPGDYQSIEKDLTDLINRQSRENRSNTPDFILAQFMARCLKAAEDAVNARDSFYGIRPEPGKRPGDPTSMKGPMTAEEEKEYVVKAQKKLKEVEEKLTRNTPGQMFGPSTLEGATTDWLNLQKVQKAIEENAVAQQARHVGGKTFSFRCDQCGEAITMPVSADPATHKSVCSGRKGTFRYGQVPVDPAGTIITTTVSNCARCGGTHKNLNFKILSGEPIGEYTHWATCPKTGEPIALLITMQNGEKGYDPK